MTDAFVSYTHIDEAWAEWIAWTLEEAGYPSILQKWDFRPGNNFVLEMQRAAAAAERTVMVLSADYIESAFAAPEWAAAFAQDPTGLGRKLVPVRVGAVDPTGLLGSIVYIDLVGKSAADAREALLNGFKPGRAKPSSAPAFPGAPHSPAPFPGRSTTATKAPAQSMRIRRPATDLEKRRFLRDAFHTIGECFEGHLHELKRNNQGLETDFERESATTMRAEIYVQGKLKANCKIWIGGLYGDNGISFAEGSTANMGGAINEMISLTDGDELALRATMDMGLGGRSREIDTSRMSADDAARYLWARFMWRLT